MVEELRKILCWGTTAQKITGPPGTLLSVLYIVGRRYNLPALVAFLKLNLK